MCTPKDIAIFGSMTGGMNRGPQGTPTTAQSSPYGSPQGSGYSFPSEGAAELQLTGPEPGTPGLVPPQRIGKYAKGKATTAVAVRPGREMQAQPTGREYRPQQIFAQDFGPGPLSGGPVGDYMKRLKV